MLDPAIRRVSNAASGGPGEAPAKAGNAHRGDPGSEAVRTGPPGRASSLSQLCTDAADQARVGPHGLGLDIDAATEFWSAVTAIPASQFGKPYRAVADASIRSNKHEHGCAYVVYASAPTHRAVMGLVHALLSSEAIPG